MATFADARAEPPEPRRRRCPVPRCRKRVVESALANHLRVAHGRGYIERYIDRPKPTPAPAAANAKPIEPPAPPDPRKIHADPYGEVERRAYIEALTLARGPDGYTAEEVRDLLHRADVARWQVRMLDQVVLGLALVDVADTGLVFYPATQAREKGGGRDDE